jgi:hypothetical protein
MENPVEMGSDAKIYVPTKFHKKLFQEFKFDTGIQRHTDIMAISYYFYFLKIR